METRKITVVTTRGRNKAVIETDVKTWGDLAPLIEEEDFDLDQFVASESVRRSTLEHNDAELPEGDFRIFLRPKETKSGHDLNDSQIDDAGYRDLRAALSDSDKEFLNSHYEGKNWTQLTTTELRDGMKAINAQGGSSSSDTQEEKEEQTPADQAMECIQKIKDATSELENHEALEDLDSDYYVETINRAALVLEELIGNNLSATISKEEEDALFKEARDFVKGLR